MHKNLKRILELQDEGSWALMIEECNAKSYSKISWKHGWFAD